MSGFVLNVYQASSVCSLISLNAVFRVRLVIVKDKLNWLKCVLAPLLLVIPQAV